MRSMFCCIILVTHSNDQSKCNRLTELFLLTKQFSDKMTGSINKLIKHVCIYLLGLTFNTNDAP